MSSVLLVVASMFVAAAPSVADDDLEITAPTLLGDGFAGRVSVVAWLPRFDGDVRIGGQSISLRDDFDHGGTRWAPWGDLELRWDEWEFRLSGYTISEDASTIAGRAFDFGAATVNPGDQVSSDLSIDSIQVEGGVTLWRPFHSRRSPWSDARELTDPQRDRAERVDLRFGVVAGAKWIGLDHDVRVRDGGGALLSADSRDADWVALYAGPKIELAMRTREQLGFVDSIVVSGVGVVGGVVSSGSGTLFEVRAGIDFMFTPNFGLSLGYRLQNLDFDDGDYTFDGSLQGLVVGGAIRF